MITAAICTIGDEILIGQIVDTNSSMIAKELNKIGVKVSKMVSISDDKDDIINSIKTLASTNNIIITTGGLGPTKDDITKNALALLTNADNFVVNKEQLDVVKRILKTRGLELTDINRDQALVPNTCKVIVNECGTAPCMEFKLNIGKENCILYSLPGVPFETKETFPKVINSIKEHFNLDTIYHKTVATFGIPESTLAKTIEEWEDNLPKEVHLAYLPNPILGVRLRLSIYTSANNLTIEDAEEIIEKCINKLKEIIPNAIYGYGDSNTEISLQSTIANFLKEHNKTIATAESCTGGFLASLFTEQPGASKYFYGGVISYDNSVKIDTLGVNKETIDKFGAVSRECVEEMAKGVLTKLNTDYAIATSGIAGPTGGTAAKPVGTLWVAVADKERVISKDFKFPNNRKVNIERFAAAALNLFRENFINNI